MQMLDGALVHSASDLNNFSECLHLVALERAVAAGAAVRPQRDDPTSQLLARKGDEHERHHLERLRATFGDQLVAFEDRPLPTRASYLAAERESTAAMARGVDVIYQATFFDGAFLGRADFLIRVDEPSARWPWSYEVVDTKLALSPKPYFLVQLCNYSEHVARIQGSEPSGARIVLGSGDERRFRIAEYAAYYRHLKAAYLTSIAQAADAYPVECAHCDLCSWRDACAARRSADDHLSLVAGIRRDQIRKLTEADIPTLSALAQAADDARPGRMPAETFVNLRAQAAEQHRYRHARMLHGTAVHSYTFRPGGPETGLARLPRPSRGDIFFDMEGDPMYRPDRALEYLFGVYLPDGNRYVPFWGTTPAAERAAFEAFVDFVVARQREFPDLHVYHYAPYETSALKRLMGRYASRENEIDRFLVAGTFIDLYPVVKQSIWISQPSYSIKKVEALYGFTRHTQTRGGDDSIVMFESWLESQDPAVLDDIRAYNEDDCRSTHALRDWLVRLRDEFNATSAEPLGWREDPPERAPVDDSERSALETQLLDGIPVPDSLAELRRMPERSRGRWLLGNLIQYHRREQKPEWWEYFYRREHQSELVEGDTRSLGGLQRCVEIAPYKRKPRDRNAVYTFRYPEQEHEMRPGSEPLDPQTGKSAGDVIAVDDLDNTITLKVSSELASTLTALIPRGPLNVTDKKAAVERIAHAYYAGTLDDAHPATAALLLKRQPRLSDRPAGAVIQPGSGGPVTKEALAGIVSALDDSYLVVQGPPGSGKSTLGAHVIVDLLAAGKRIALAAHTHKALHNLLHKIEQTAHARGVVFRGCHKSAAANSDSVHRPLAPGGCIDDAPTSDAFDGCQLVSATTFAWADARHAGSFDVVVIDEAGQVSLADALVTSTVARSTVLLGDPQQLPQVSKGSHPVGTNVSILEHLLAGAATIGVTSGVFLDRSYRMQPEIDAYVSNAFYEGRLDADELNAANEVVAGDLAVAGPRYIPVEHEDNARKSREEAHCIVGEIRRLLDGGTTRIRSGASRPLTPADILVVAPYNAQRALIDQALREAGIDGVAVGTVDKFQGQEAPVALYSMATSSAELAPRGLDFLLNGNRLNVAVSRAQALSVLICSPQLLKARAATVEHMRLLNLLCAYAEAAAASAARSRTFAAVAGISTAEQLTLIPL